MLRRICLVLAALPAIASAQVRPDDDPALVERARAIHARVLTLDTHKDISPLLASAEYPDEPDRLAQFLRETDPTVDGNNQVDFPKMRRGGLDCAFFIVYVGQGDVNPPAFRRAYAQAKLKFTAVHRMCARFPEHIEFAYTPGDVRRIAAAGKLVATIGIENGYPMGEDLANIAEFQALGARYMSICHNRHNQLGDSHTPEEPLHGGLTELGRAAIAEMNRLGIMVDISHAAKTTMLQAVAASRAPVIGSHSGCRAVCDVSRNLDDEQLLALARNGGVVQLVALDSFVKDQTGRNDAVRELRAEVGLPRRGRTTADGEELSADEYAERLGRFETGMRRIEAEFPRANVADFVDHVDHAVRLIGIDHIGIASDFDGGGGVDGWDSAAETFHVTLEMVRRGYSEAEIGQIWSGNLLRVWGEVQAIAERIQGGM